MLITEWSVSDGFDAVEAAAGMLDAPIVWTDGSLVPDQVTGVSSSGAGFFTHQSEHCWGERRWGHVDRVRADGVVPSSRGSCSVPGPLQTVQRAEWPCSLLVLCIWEVDNLNVVRHVGRLLNGHRGSTPLEIVNDGDLLLLIEKMLYLRSVDTDRISQVKGHADEDMVLDGREREQDRVGEQCCR